MLADETAASVIGRLLTSRVIQQTVDSPRHGHGRFAGGVCHSETDARHPALQICLADRALTIGAGSAAAIALAPSLQAPLTTAASTGTSPAVLSPIYSLLVGN
jgi:hypothetical protein